MADDADRSLQDQEFLHEKAIKLIRESQAEPVRKATGFCLWCSEPLGQGLVFCPPLDASDDGCKLDYEKDQRSQRMKKV